MTSQIGKQLKYTLHILPDMWRRKGSHAMKFDQLIKYWNKNYNVYVAKYLNK